MKSFNLIDSPWIPVRYGHKTKLLSLTDLFLDSENITDLSCVSHERIAITRLLIAIASAAVGPVQYDDELPEIKPLIVNLSVEYLKKWHDSFDLFDANNPFLQVGNLTCESISKLEKINILLSSGSTTTWRDNAGGSQRSFSPDSIARSLLAYQGFALNGRIGFAKWDGIPTGSGGLGTVSSEAAPLHNILNTLLIGSNLLETIYLNIISVDHLDSMQFGKPIWEFMPKNPKDEAAIKNATETYLGRLVFLSRTVKIIDEQHCLLSNGLSYPELYDPFSTIVTDKDGKPISVKPNVEQSLWRQLPAILNATTAGKPRCLVIHPNEIYKIWVGGTAGTGGVNATIKGVVESIFQISNPKAYIDGADFAYKNWKKLENSIKSFCITFFNNPSKNDVNYFKKSAEINYWASLDRSVYKLFKLEQPEQPEQPEQNIQKQEWERLVKNSAYEAFDLTCPKTNWKALAVGRQCLNQ